MKEKNIQTIWNNWCAKHWEYGTAAFELKISHKDSIPFSAVQDHQYRALRLAKKKLVYKISDFDITARKPFDSFLLQSALAYVGICWYEPRKKKLMVLIDVDKMIEERESSDRKSLTQERAEEISDYIIDLNLQ
jgi:hypothetical protein